MTDYAAAYRGVRERVADLVGRLDDGGAEQPVPATPEWSVRDALAHLVGVSADVAAGNIAGAGTDEWTAVQVEARRGQSIADLLAEWHESATTVEAVMNDFGAGAGQMVFDAVTHEHDLRGALCTFGARDTDALAIGFEWLCASMAGRGNGALRLVTEDGPCAFGPGDPVATVEASRFDLFRGATGRRSSHQMGAWRWDPEPRPDVLVVSPPFTMRVDELVE